MKVQINLGDSHPGWMKGSKQLAYAVKMMLAPLINIDLLYLASFKVPPLYTSGVRYQKEPPNTVEDFAAIPVVISRGWGDCDDLACWRIAELRHAGERASARVSWEKHPNGRLYHILVRRERYPLTDPRSVEDPSLLLGM